MPRITFLPQEISVDIDRETDLITVAEMAGIEINAPCGTNGTCGKCIVRIASGEVHTHDTGMLSQTAIQAGYVHACKSKTAEVDVTIVIPERLSKKGKFADFSKDIDKINPGLLPEVWQIQPLSKRYAFQVPLAQPEDGLSDLDRLNATVKAELGDKDMDVPLPIMRNLAQTLREEQGNITLTVASLENRHQITTIHSGNRKKENYGLAIDIGTTTVSVQLTALSKAEIISVKTNYNQQIKCGLDVISRINYAQRPERLQELQTRVQDTINSLIASVVKNQNLESSDITNLVCSGNTTMIHLLLGLPPEEIRLDPYTPTILHSPYFTAGDIGIAINPNTPVHISPAVASYVGGDITAGLLCTDIVTESEELSLFIDIGTNGELALGNCDFITTCACSAGPAFEGGGIKHGMRAAAGAIEKVTIDKLTGMSKFQTVGDIPPVGICGSGMISLLANLLTTGWIDSAGKLDRTRPCPAIEVNGRQAYYTLSAPTESSTDPIVVSETEIENIIRAKAAIYSACALMLDQVGLSFDELNTIYIAGGFGHFLNLEDAITIGLLPDQPREKFQYIGNASLTGSYMVLVSADHRKKQIELAQRMTYIELSTEVGYMDQYTAALFLPHTDLSQFPSVLLP